jgi:hypothetical protein
VLVGDVLDDVLVEHPGTQLLGGRGTGPVEDSPAGPDDVLEDPGVQLEDAELPLDVQDPRFHGGHRLERQVDHALDRQRRRHLDDQGVVPLERRVAAGAGGRAHVRGELLLQVLHEQVHP